VELGVGTGRIAIPAALAGAHVIGVDSSAGMLAVCAERAREAGVGERLDLRLGDLRRPPVDERADWDLAEQTLTLSVRGRQGSSTMTLWWLEPERWHSLLAEAGFEVLECYGWFDRRPFTGGEDSVWIARRK